MGSVGFVGSVCSVGSVGSVENPHLTHWTHLTHLTHTASQWQGAALQQIALQHKNLAPFNHPSTPWA